MKLIYLIYRCYARFVLSLSDRQLRGLSWIIYVLIYHIARYRRGVVTENLRKSFPDKREADIRLIRRVFYRNFSAIFHEVMNYRKYDGEQMLERVSYENPEVLRDLQKEGRSIMIVTGHCGSWELLGLTLPLVTGCRTFGAAIKQSDDFFNKEINDIRTRLGLEIVQSKSVYRSLLKHRDEQFAAFLIADQTPPKGEIDYWTTFMNQDTPVFLGPEHIARAMNLPVVFAAMRRRQMGRYSVTFTLVAEDVALTPPHEVTERHVRMLEALIHEQPDSWLWSHRRWKHKKTPNA